MHALQAHAASIVVSHSMLMRVQSMHALLANSLTIQSSTIHCTRCEEGSAVLEATACAVLQQHKPREGHLRIILEIHPNTGI